CIIPLGARKEKLRGQPESESLANIDEVNKDEV
ncbi:MAG: hypothetical protein UW26_C0004G0021, partial [Candidatus Collierbacteria bacterium GW2011_GWF1_44_12]